LARPRRFGDVDLAVGIALVEEMVGPPRLGKAARVIKVPGAGGDAGNGAPFAPDVADGIQQILSLAEFTALASLTEYTVE